MARGWESKSVEEQISEREAESQTSSKPKPSRREIEESKKRESIRLARSHALTALESARNERYRALLHRTVAHLDSELAKLS